MSKMGKWLLIFGIVALVGAVLFGVSVAAFGVRDNNFGISMGGKDISLFNIGGTAMNFIPGNAGIHFREDGTNIDFEFEADKEYSKTFHPSEVKNVNLSLASCQASISVVEGQSFHLTYRTGTGRMNFTAELQDDTLTISEKPGSWFNLGSIKSSTLIIAMPKKQYETLKFELASGSIRGSDITADSFDAQVASGKMELGIFADNMDLDIASGKMILTNSTDSKISGISVDAASGSVTLDGFGADSTNINIASGNITMNGVSGSVDANIASGTVKLVYSEWDDALSLDLMSGKADITLPEGSGAAVNYERASGSINIALDSDNVTLSKGGTATVGGANVQNVKAHVMSGSISIHN